ncbi:galactose-1-phosphate uridylyltransferase [Hydrogenimonas sp.]
MSDIRYDLLHDDYALIAPERLRRPDCYKTGKKSSESKFSDRKKCPFCEGRERLTPHEIFAIRDNDPDGPGWKTRVVPNLYKAVQIETPWQSEEVGIYEKWSGFGAHEVVIDTPRHLTRMDDWSEEEYFNWLYTLRSRLNDLKNDSRLVYISLFKNHGHYGGATQSHPHTQIIALAALPYRQRQLLLHAHNFYKSHGHSLFESVLHMELDDKKRIVAENDIFAAICPYASTFAFETYIVCKKPHAFLNDLDDNGLEALADLLSQTIKALYRQVGDFDFNILFNTPAMHKNAQTEDFFDDTDKMWRIGVRILPRLYRLGGFELSSGVKINPLDPDEAASLLRGSIKERE